MSDSAAKIFSLREVALSIKKTLDQRYGSSFWVKAEMNKLNLYKHSGHCYPELVEKSGGQITAQLRAILWNKNYLRINQQFLRLLNEPLKDGIKILFRARIDFDPVHGLALQIEDIDPAFTLGDIEREKEETISRLKKEGVFEKNKQKKLSLLPQRIAIISVESSKGFADFTRVLQTNPWQYRFFQLLFPSLLQGDKAVQSIIGQLNQIRKVLHHFDAVAIIRGGGGDVGLSCYNNYRLAKTVAEYPIPVLTGIGHATNETVVEMVSYQNAITPTKIAEFLLMQFHQFADPVSAAASLISKTARRILADEKLFLKNQLRLFSSATRNRLDYGRSEINKAAAAFGNASRRSLELNAWEIRKQIDSLGRESLRLVNLNRANSLLALTRLKANTGILTGKKEEQLVTMEKHIKLMDPANLLRRGYSITTQNGKLVQSANTLKSGDEIETILSYGRIRSRIINGEKDNT